MFLLYINWLVNQSPIKSETFSCYTLFNFPLNIWQKTWVLSCAWIPLFCLVTVPIMAKISSYTALLKWKLKGCHQRRWFIGTIKKYHHGVLNRKKYRGVRVYALKLTGENHSLIFKHPFFSNDYAIKRIILWKNQFFILLHLHYGRLRCKCFERMGKLSVKIFLSDTQD